MVLRISEEHEFEVYLQIVCPLCLAKPRADSNYVQEGQSRQHFSNASVMCLLTSPTSRAGPTTRSRLESRVGVGQELLKVGLEPLASLRSRLESIRKATVVVVAGGAGVAGAIALATGLDPDEGVEEVMAGVGGRANTEAGALSTMLDVDCEREG